MKDSMRMLKQVQAMQARMGRIHEELESETVEASAGGGAVRAVASGSQKLVSISISPEAVEDMDMLQDLVLAATNDALEQSRALASRRMGELASGLGLPPGLA